MSTAIKTADIDRIRKTSDDLLKAVIFIMLFPILCFCGCTRNVERQEVIGTYYANHGLGVDSLIIDKGGKFKLNFYPDNSSSSYHAEGEWIFIDTVGSQGIMFIYEEIQFSIDPTEFPCHYMLNTIINGSPQVPQVFAYAYSNEIEIIISDCNYRYIKKYPKDNFN